MVIQNFSFWFIYLLTRIFFLIPERQLKPSGYFSSIYVSSSRSKSRTNIGSISRNKMFCPSDWSTPKYKRNCSHTSAMTNPETMKTKRLPERLEIFDSLVACDHNHTLLWWIHKTSTAFIVNFWLNNIFWQHADNSLVKWAIGIIMFINKSRILEKLSKWMKKSENYIELSISSQETKKRILPLWLTRIVIFVRPRFFSASIDWYPIAKMVIIMTQLLYWFSSIKYIG